MTDQNIPAVTDDDRRQAYEWAKSVESNLDTWGGRLRAPARVILNAVPAPPRPTLADMYAEEWDECTGMQADLAQGDRVVILDGTPDHDGLVQVLEKSLDVYRPSPEDVTPRPDLPRMEWPDTGQDGEEATKVDYVSVAGGRTAYGPWTVARLRKKPDTVPLNTLAVGSEWADGEALTRACQESGRDQITVTDCEGDVYVWDANQDDWRDLHPIQKYAPFTVIHAGKKADQ